MTNEQIQEAIESARAWLLPQTNTTTTPTYELRDATITYVKKLQEIQVVRAGLLIEPGVQVIRKKE